MCVRACSVYRLDAAAVYLVLSTIRFNVFRPEDMSIEQLTACYEKDQFGKYLLKILCSA